MAGFIQADTGYLLEVAGELDPAPATAAKTAATQARDLAPACGDPLPGCQSFNAAVVQLADQLIDFCTATESGIQAYAAVARETAGLYSAANNTARETFGGGPWASLS
jgi:hypothetical protein